MELTLLELFRMGGWAMWPLVVFSVVTMVIILERGIVFATSNTKVDELLGSTVPALQSGNVTGALEIAEKTTARTMVRPVFLAALRARDLGDTRIERSFESAAGKQIHILERGLDLLVALGSIAPITGFLGTVSGMISAFNSIATAADVNAQLVAGGIFEALITTAFGLAIAIVAITGYNLFAHIVDRFTADLEEAGNELVTALLSGKNGTSR